MPNSSFVWMQSDVYVDEDFYLNKQQRKICETKFVANYFQSKIMSEKRSTIFSRKKYHHSTRDSSYWSKSESATRNHEELPLAPPLSDDKHVRINLPARKRRIVLLPCRSPLHSHRSHQCSLFELNLILHYERQGMTIAESPSA